MGFSILGWVLFELVFAFWCFLCFDFGSCLFVFEICRFGWFGLVIWWLGVGRIFGGIGRNFS